MDYQDSEDFKLLENALQQQIDENKSLKKGCIELSKSYVSFVECFKMMGDHIKKITTENAARNISFEEMNQFLKNFTDKVVIPSTLYFDQNPNEETKLLIPGILCSKDLHTWLMKAP